MKLHLFALASLSVISSAAYAADKPAIGPAPAWVKPVSLPSARTKGDDAPVHILLSNQQVALAPGRQTMYSEIALRIQTPQGLAAGNVSVPWDPDSDELTVHKLLIRRGNRVIDVLASGQTFTVVRRETGLESAALDGVLTANIQPEGLQVGDILEFAASVTTSDPTLKGHVELIAGAWNGAPIGRAHLRIQWPSSLPARLRPTASLPALKPVTANGITQVELSIDNVEPLMPPKGAPPRYRLGRLVELTDFASWADLGALMAPLYQKAAVLPSHGPLNGELERIRGASSGPKARAEAALALVQDRVRYVALAMGTGGLVPADAATTWSRRYGDCKGKTALLLALLHALDIQAEPVAVSTVLGDGLDARLPMVALFDHVLVRATIAGRTYWLDGTRTGDTSLDRLGIPAFGWGLPLIPQGASLTRMLPPPLETPTQATAIRIDATAGLTVPAPTKIETILRGDEAITTNLALAHLAGDARDRALREHWRGQYDFVDIQSTSASFDSRTGELRLSMEGLAKLDWSDGWLETHGTGVGYEADFSRDPGPDREAPFAVPYPYSTKTVETILLPPGFSGLTSGPDAELNQTVAGIEYRRKATLANNIFVIEKTERSVAPEFPSKDAAAAQKTLRELAEKAVYIRKLNDYQPTEAELSAALASTPTTADALLERGNILLQGGRFDDAIKDFDRVVALEPGNAWGHANRGIAFVWKGDHEAAARDLDAAHAIDPRNRVVFRARGLMAQQKGAFKEAVAAYTTALEIDPNSSFALGHRAEAQRSAGNNDAALLDAAAALKREPTWVSLYLLRANIFRSQGKQDEAIAEADAVAAANPRNSYAHVVAASIYSAFKKDAEAMAAYDRALALKPEPHIYLNRAFDRPKADTAGRRADIEAALRLDPTSHEAFAVKADLQLEGGDAVGAIATYSAAIAASPDYSGHLVGRGIAYALAGDMARAEKDFAAARAKAADARSLNNHCWSKATAGVALESALVDCNGALSKAPDTAAYLDSRGLVLLRLGRLDEALVDYDRALAKFPNQASSLFGRAVAWARKGDKTKSDADAAAALKANPDIRTQFEAYGIKL